MSSKETKKILLSIKTPQGHGVSIISRVLAELKKALKLTGASAVYRVERRGESLVSLRDIRSEEHIEGFSVVLSGETTERPEKVYQRLVEIEEQFQQESLRRTVSINFLFYGEEVVLMPRLSLPHPEMHLRPEEAVPAAEMWPNYLHPVLGKTLLELANDFSEVRWGEFFARGDTLLDFGPT